MIVPNGPPWTPEQDAVLKRYGGRIVMASLIERISAAGPPRTKYAVYARAGDLKVGLRYRHHKRKPPKRPAHHRWDWTEEQDRRMFALLGRQRIGAIVAILNEEFGTRRTENSVNGRLNRLRRHGALHGVLSVVQVMAILPFRRETLIGFIERGWLEAERGSGFGGREILIRPAALERFIREHVWTLDWRKVRAGHWRDLARQASLKDPYITAEEAARVLRVGEWVIREHCRAGDVPGLKHRETLNSTGYPSSSGYRIPLSALDALDARISARNVRRTGPTTRQEFAS